jgi:hypothetical protein
MHVTERLGVTLDCTVAVCTDGALSEVTIGYQPQLWKDVWGRLLRNHRIVRQQAIQNRILKSEYVISGCSCSFYREFLKKFFCKMQRPVVVTPQLKLQCR